MQQLIYFFQKYKYVLFFLLLQITALFLTINNHNYHKSKFISSANGIAGSIYTKKKAVTDYLNLKERNLELTQENEALRNKLEKLKTSLEISASEIISDTNNFQQKFQYINGIIIKNEFHKAYNYLTLNRGSNDSITSEMAVVNHKGIIGTTDAVSANYARVRSILNRNSEINVRLKTKDETGNYFYGSISWDGENHKIVQLTDIPRQAVLSVGDSVITSGRSTIFPEGIPVGKIIDLKNRNQSNSIDVELFNDMNMIREVYIIRNFHKIELKNLEESTNE